MRSRGVLLCDCVCSWEPVRVVHGDGRVRSLSRPTTVQQLLACHPHHFVCEPTSEPPLYHTGMLSLDTELEEGRIYLILPLPRLLPPAYHLSNNNNMFSTTTPSCPCFTPHASKNIFPSSSCNAFPSATAGSVQGSRLSNTLLQWTSDKKFLRTSRIGRWFSTRSQQLLAAASTVQQKTGSCIMRSLVHMSHLKIFHTKMFCRNSSQDLHKLHEPHQLPSKQAILCRVQSSRNRWRPGLECISEVELMAGLLEFDSVCSHEARLYMDHDKVN
ncbi:unnamed protein product [Sphagnum jensenii]|uniref:Uncharacterized protein n=1 Tax=Sphagnum jensenii TaxID=128206 RepID=A0ABP0W4M0_9BRYO